MTLYNLIKDYTTGRSSVQRLTTKLMKIGLESKNGLPCEAAFADVMVAGHCDRVLEKGLTDDAFEDLLDLGIPLLQKKIEILNCTRVSCIMKKNDVK
jgi:hypothetical protein